MITAGVPESNINVFQVDVTDTNSVKWGGIKARETFGDVEILINNAGIISGK